MGFQRTNDKYISFLKCRDAYSGSDVVPQLTSTCFFLLQSEIALFLRRFCGSDCAIYFSLCRYVVAFTVERYIIVWFPLRKDRLCTSRRSRTVVICLAFTGCLIYSFKTWTSGIVYIDTLALCMPYPQYYNFLTAMKGLDSVLTLIIPSVIVVILNIRIIMKIISVERQRRPFVRQVSINQGVKIQQEFAVPGKGKESIHESLASSRIVHVKFNNSNSSDKNQANGMITMAVQNGTLGGMAVVLPIDRKSRSRSSRSNSGSPELMSKRKHNNNSRTINNNKVRKSTTLNTNGQTVEGSKSEDIFRKCQTRVHVKGHRQNRTARMLIIVSSVFVVLKLPTHVFRLHTFIQTSIHDDYSSTRKLDIRWQELFQLIYYLNFAINFFIYSACGRQFRTGLRILYARMERKVRKIRRLFCGDNGAIPISSWIIHLNTSVDYLWNNICFVVFQILPKNYLSLVS